MSTPEVPTRVPADGAAPEPVTGPAAVAHPAGLPADHSADRAAARVVDVGLRAVGALIALCGGVLAAVISVLLVPLRLDTPVGLVRVPVAIGFAAAAAVVTVWYARRVAGARAAVLPALGWLALVVVTMSPPRQGSQVLVPNDWVGALTLFAGTAVFTVAVVRSLVGSSRRSVRPEGHG